jgi:hypothetical protein
MEQFNLQPSPEETIWLGERAGRRPLEKVARKQLGLFRRAGKR